MTNDKVIQLSPEKIKYSPIEQAIEAIQQGKFIIVADDEGRENEGDLICAAEKITADHINFMLREARGMICVSMSEERVEALQLNQMVEDNTDPNQTAFTVTVDAGPEFGVTTGISASDRAITIQRLATPNATAQDFRRPGHTSPIKAKTGGVFRRVGHTEAAIDFTRLAGLSPMGVICEILNDDGTMARRDDLVTFAKKHDLPFVTIAQLIQYRMQHERTITRRIAKELETRYGVFTAVGYKDALDGCEHLALIKGPIENLAHTTPFVRIQHENILTDVLGRNADDMPVEMAQALALIQEKESGVVVYLRHRDDSIHGLLGSLKAYNPATQAGYGASKADLREYGVGAQILADLGVGHFHMLGQSPRKVVALRGYGLKIVNTVPLATENFDFAEPPKVALSSATTPVVTETAQEEVPQVVLNTPQEETVQEVAATHYEETAVSSPEEVAPIKETVVMTVSAPPAGTVQTAQNENNKKVEDDSNDLRAEPREPRFSTMKMGGQIMSGQALFEG
jgi:3,4-dihydroxy 2-butanone 4-phosphate synthase / GTP cyclohydrolase II